MLELDWIKQCVIEQSYFYSAHGDQERLADNLTLGEVEEVVHNGIILENYEDTGRVLSCLVAGFTSMGKPIHIVIGRKMDRTVIITVYIPTAPKFITPYQRNRP